MGTNNAPYCTPEKMVDQILGLKNFTLQKLPACQIIISAPTLSTDNTTVSLIAYLTVYNSVPNCVPFAVFAL